MLLRVDSPADNAVRAVSRRFFVFHRRRKGVGVVTLIVAFALAMGAYAFTNSNSGGTGTRAGYVAATVSGYTISNPAYTFNADATKIDQIAFDLDAAATVEIGRAS